MTEFVLASSSPRRKQLLRNLGIEFETIESEADENVDMPPHETVIELSGRKATYVAELRPNSVVIGADTIVLHNGIIMGKPENAQMAFDMLKILQGSVHTVYTGVCVIYNNEKHFGVEMTDVHMCGLSDSEIREYIKTGEPMDKAGAYGIQELGSKFIKRIDGCYFNVVGLPLNLLWGMLKSIHVL